jgi:hypothetical protein
VRGYEDGRMGGWEDERMRGYERGDFSWPCIIVFEMRGEG